MKRIYIIKMFDSILWKEDIVSVCFSDREDAEKYRRLNTTHKLFFTFVELVLNEKYEDYLKGEN